MYAIRSYYGTGVYYVGKEPLELASIIEGLEASSFIKVDAGNADTYLDPGTATGTCGS